MTEQARIKAKQDLFNIVSNHAMKDYLQVNYKNGKKKSKKHIPYSLSQETEQAKELYNIVCSNSAEEITLEQEEILKYHLLQYRLLRPEYLQPV